MSDELFSVVSRDHAAGRGQSRGRPHPPRVDGEEGLKARTNEATEIKTPSSLPGLVNQIVWLRARPGSREG